MRTVHNCLYLSVLLLGLLPAAPLRAGTDKNIVIKERKEPYEFTNGDAKNPVWVKQHFSTTYRCNEFRGTIPYSTFYDDYSRIDDIKAYVSSKPTRNN